MALGAPAPGIAAQLGAVAVLAVVCRAALASDSASALFSEFVPTLGVLVDLFFALVAMALTGGIRSELVVLPLASLVLARRALGAPASRFLAVTTVLGLGLLAALSAAGAPPWSSPFALRILWPLALLAALEVRAPRAASHAESSDHEVATARTAPAGAAAPLPMQTRDARSEILHDLKSPLSVIRVYADLIADRARRGEMPLEEHLANLASEVELMELLVDSPSSRRSSHPTNGGPAAPADLARVLASLAESYRLAHGDKVRIGLSAERPRVPVAADPVALQRIFRNILDNAVQYTPPGGEVRIRLGVTGHQAFVVVSDTGVGMTPEERARAFEFAYRGEGGRVARAAGRGLGLGLARELVEASGGRISLSSEEGRGSDIRILLPLASEGRG